MKTVAVITSTRAEYGLLSPVIKKLREFEDDEFKVELIVTGTHLVEEYGNTVKDIDERIDYKISIPVKSETEQDISNNQAETLKVFTGHFITHKYSAIVILGDRYEMLSIAIAAGNTKTPIFHLCGGDTTEGAVDEWIRHSITKMSYLHFVTNEDSKRRVIQLGESPNRVFNFGSTSIDNILYAADMSAKEALHSIGLNNCKYALCTFHPVTMETNTVEAQLNSLVEAMRAFPNIEFIITKSNADQGGALVNKLLESFCNQVNNIHLFASLGMKRYLSLMRYSEFVIGNSSSGIIETPAFHIPTINIGDRQKGRLRTPSIIDCGTEKVDIISAITKATSEEFKNICKTVISPYGDGKAAEQIADKIFFEIQNDRIDLKKRFYNM